MSETKVKVWKRGEKRALAVSIMTRFNTEFPDEHRYEDCTKEIGEQIGIPEGSARSYYTYIVDNKIIPDFKPAEPTRKPRAPTEAKVTTAGSKDETNEKRGTDDRLATIRAVAAKRGKKNPQTATERVTELAASGAHHQIAETETVTELEPA